MKKILVLLAVLVMTLAMTACNIEPSDDGSDVDMINVAIEIIYPEDAEQDDVQASMIVEEGTNAMEQLYSYADDNNIDIVLDESSPTIYVTSINGVEQTGEAGWIYKLNDEIAMEQASDIILEEGSKVTWAFTSWDDM